MRKLMMAVVLIAGGCRTELLVPADAGADAAAVDAIPADDFAGRMDAPTTDADGGKCAEIGEVCYGKPCCQGAIILHCCPDSYCALGCP